jgi:Ca2+-binding RTX toxin-like protein
MSISTNSMSQERGFVVAGTQSKPRKLTDLFLDDEGADIKAVIKHAFILPAHNDLLKASDFIDPAEWFELRNTANGTELWLKAGITLTDDIFIDFKGISGQEGSFFWLRVMQDEDAGADKFKISLTTTDATVIGSDGDDHLTVRHAQNYSETNVNCYGVNRIYAGSGDDLVEAGNGRDLISGQSGDDILFASGGDDVIRGGRGDDILLGGHGDDVLRGGRGNGRLNGGDGADNLRGGRGDDILDGSDGQDTLIGGTGNDIFVLGAAGDNDLIKDFARGDQLDFIGGGKTAIFTKTVGKNTLLLNGSGENAEIYATLRGFTDGLTDIDGHDANIAFVDLDIV